MGIDIYARWRKQTKAEKSAQITGFCPTSGDVGYLREAYHGGPYVTKFFVEEAFDHDRPDFREDWGVPIAASVMRERLPHAVLLSLYREWKVYGQGDNPGVLNVDDPCMPKTLSKALANVLEHEMKDNSHRFIASSFPQKLIEEAKARIESKNLPDIALAFVEFVELCEAKERKTGKPCYIYASY